MTLLLEAFHSDLSMERFEWEHLTLSHHPTKFGIHMLSDRGDIKILLVTEHYMTIFRGSCKLRMTARHTKLPP